MSRYFIAIIPPAELAEEIYRIKKHVAEVYGSKGAQRSPAHITLHMPFELNGRKEEQLMMQFGKEGIQSAPFTIELKNFSCFEPRVIYIDVIQSVELQKLQMQVVDRMKKEFFIFNQSDDARGFHPHVTVAFRDLKKPVFYTAWNEFKSLAWNKRFICTAVSVLKLDEEGWKEVKQIPLTGK